jgi:lipid-binding SYLF domain-containing protein
MTHHGRDSGVPIAATRTGAVLRGALCVLSMVGAASIAAAQSDEADRIRGAATVFDEIMKAPDKAIPALVLNKAEGIAVFPGTLKGGFIVAAHHGRGILSVRDSTSGAWSPPAFLALTGGSIGAQVGAQAIDVVLIIMGRMGIENLVRNEFQIGADAGVAAGPLGREAAASTDIQLRAQILSYSRSRGLFAGVSLKGSSIREDADANRNFYGKALRTREIVFDRASGAPEPVAQWHAMLARYIR